jgi:predicted glutamine amidotransferase
MCRLFALHAGTEDFPACFWLLDAPTSVADLSHDNPDGYGLATFTAAGELDVLKRPVLAAEDEAFVSQSRISRAATFLAHVRYADTGEVSVANTHPFVIDDRVFAHNGVVGDLDMLDRRLPPGLVQGQTDSERLFALIATAIREHDGDVRAAIVAATTRLAREIELYSINFVLTTSTELWALRYPEKNELFFLERAPGGPRGNRHLDEASAYGTLRMRAAEAAQRPVVVIASEPMDEDPGWVQIASGELVHVGPDLRVDRELVLPDPPARPMVLSGRAVQSQAQEHD